MAGSRVNDSVKDALPYNLGFVSDGLDDYKKELEEVTKEIIIEPIRTLLDEKYADLNHAIANKYLELADIIENANLLITDSIDINMQQMMIKEEDENRILKENMKVLENRFARFVSISVAVFFVIIVTLSLQIYLMIVG